MPVVELSHFEFIRVNGPDSIEFLQGQLTCDMESLTASRSLAGAICNLKGRVIADFQTATREDGCVLRTTGSNADSILSTLAKYAVFSKVELEIDSVITRAFGFIGDDSTELLNSLFGSVPMSPGESVSISSGVLIRLPGSLPRYEVWCGDAELITAIESSCAVEDSIASWQREDVKAGIFHVDSNTTEEYTPQLLNYDISGVIDFNKGCYTGQEVVARMYYRGKPKKRLFLLASEHPLDAASELQQLEGESTKIAEVMTISNSPADSTDPNLVLAILDTAAVENKANFVFSNQSESFLQIQSLPYTE